MPEAFKNNFNVTVITEMAHFIALSSSELKYEFDADNFIIMATDRLDTLELKARSNQIACALAEHLPANFTQAAAIIKNALAPSSEDETILFTASAQGLAGWIMMPITDYVSQAALQQNGKWFAQGLTLLHACTQRFSAEFSIRPFLRDFTSQTLRVLSTWAQDDNVHVRRLVSEGTRPFLPWGIRLHVFANDPSPILPLLEQLKDDRSEYVRRSVANNLNDIAKNHPDLVVQIAKNWWNENDIARTKLIKHACRTLLKDGHPDALALFGYPPAKIENISLVLSAESLEMGAEQHMTLHIENTTNHPQKLLVDYAVHHQKMNGKLSPKVFKWTSIELAPNCKKILTKKHSFKPVTTRKYYSGQHKIEVLVNGKALAVATFHLY